MSVTSRCGNTPVLCDTLGPEDVNQYWVAWGAELGIAETIVTSTWVIPATCTLVSDQTDQTVTDPVSGVEYPSSNGILVRFPATQGVYTLKNQCLLSSGRRLTRDFAVTINE